MRPSEFISGVGDVLHALNVEDSTIEEILKSLDVATTELPGDQSLPPVGTNVFSSLPAGHEMSTHTNAAQEYLAGALAEMLQILGLYTEGVTAIHHGNIKTDEFAADDLTKIRQVVEQANQFNNQPRPHGQGNS